LFAENEDIFYLAYVSEQNLILDGSSGPCNHPDIKKMFSDFDGEIYSPHKTSKN
jgi:heat shock protein HspQ